MVLLEVVITAGIVGIVIKLKTETTILDDLLSTLKFEKGRSLSASNIIDDISKRAILAIAEVYFRYPEKYICDGENSFMIDKLKLISSKIWGEPEYVHFIFLKRRAVLITEDIDDSRIIRILGYNVETFYDALRGSLLICRKCSSKSYNELYDIMKNIIDKALRIPSLRDVLHALEVAYFKNLAKNPLRRYQSLEELLDYVNEILIQHRFRPLKLSELEEYVDRLHEEYKFSGFYRHPKAKSMPVLIEFTKRITT